MIYLFPPPIRYPSKVGHIKRNYQAFSGSLQVHPTKDENIHSYIAPELQVKLITDMNLENGFELLVAAVFSIISKLGELG